MIEYIGKSTFFLYAFLSVVGAIGLLICLQYLVKEADSFAQKAASTVLSLLFFSILIFPFYKFAEVEQIFSERIEEKVALKLNANTNEFIIKNTGTGGEKEIFYNGKRYLIVTEGDKILKFIEAQ